VRVIKVVKRIVAQEEKDAELDELEEGHQNQVLVLLLALLIVVGPRSVEQLVAAPSAKGSCASRPRCALHEGATDTVTQMA